MGANFSTCFCQLGILSLTHTHTRTLTRTGSQGWGILVISGCCYSLTSGLTHRHTDRPMDRQGNRQTDTQIDRHPDTHRQRETKRQTDSHTYTDRQTDRQTDGHRTEPGTRHTHIDRDKQTHTTERGRQGGRERKRESERDMRVRVWMCDRRERSVEMWDIWVIWGYTAL